MSVNKGASTAFGGCLGVMLALGLMFVLFAVMVGSCTGKVVQEINKEELVPSGTGD